MTGPDRHTRGAGAARAAGIALAAALCLAATAGCSGGRAEQAEAPAAGMGMGAEGASMVGAVVASAKYARLESEAGQECGAGTLTVARVLAPDDGWVVVRSAVAPGGVLGMARVPKGETRDLTVPLSAADGLGVRVALHVDRGRDGVFEFDPAFPERARDKPVFVDGRPLERAVVLEDRGVEAFSGTAGVMVEGQSLADGSMVVEYVLAPRASWLSVNLVEGGVPGRRVGLMQVQGEMQEVSLQLDEPVTSGEVAVTLHADTGVPGRFEYDTGAPFGASDPPFRSAGGIVSQRLRVE